MISIHALLAESDANNQPEQQEQRISIHALLAESDNNINSSVNTADLISIHALLAESDAKRLGDALKHLHFYPRSPCGERLWADTDYNLSDIISIHALLAESDCFF